MLNLWQACDTFALMSTTCHHATKSITPSNNYYWQNTICSMVISGMLISCPLGAHPWIAIADTGWDRSTYRLLPCPYESNCVSSNYQESPNCYMSPLRTQKRPIVAFSNAICDLSTSQTTTTTTTTIVDSQNQNLYIHLTVFGMAPNSLDDIEVVFVPKDDTGQVILILIMIVVVHLSTFDVILVSHCLHHPFVFVRIASMGI